jgi:hypothetical protein
MKNKALIKIRRNVGFFSDFFVGLVGIKYCHDNAMDFHVDWQNDLYPTLNGKNLYDEFFYQENNTVTPNLFFNNLTPYGIQLDLIANETSEDILYNFYKPFSDLINELNILNTNFFKKIPNYFENKKILGFHKRGLDHGYHGEILTDTYFSKKIDDELKKNQYDNIFIITDDNNSLSYFKKRYGKFLIYTDAIKSTGDIGLHLLPKNEYTHKLAKQAIQDAYILSMVTKKIITKSNLSTFSILCNLKRDNFVYIDKHINYKI